MWQQNPKKAKPIIRIASHELPLPDLVTLLYRHPVLSRRCSLYTICRALVRLSFLLGLARLPAVGAPDEWIVVSKDMRPSQSVGDPLEAT